MKLEKQSNAGAWTIQIDSGNFHVISTANDKVITEIHTFSGRGEPQIFRLHLTWNEVKTMAAERRLPHEIQTS